MILKMEKLSAVCLLEDRDAILRGLQRSRCVQMRPVETMVDYEDIETMTGAAQVQAYALEQQVSRYASALSAISLYAKKRGFLTPKQSVLFDALEDEAVLGQAEQICSRIEEITAKSSETRAARSKDAFTLASLQPWAENGLPLELSETRSVAIGYYLLPAKTDTEELERRQQQEAPACVLRVVSGDNEQQYLLAICHKDEEAPLWEILKSLGATKMTFGELTGTAKENIGALERRIAQADETIARCEEQLKEVGQDVFSLQYGYDALTVRLQREKAGYDLRSTQKTFCFTAWVPETARQHTLEILDRHGCYYELAQPDQEAGEEPPILLKNSKLITPYEAVTNMYSPPSYWGFDPNGFVSVFYFLFFGMMLGDAGFGLVLFFGGLWLTKKTGMKGVAQVITQGGLSAAIWGVIYGSYFGDTVQTVTRVFFGHEIVPKVFIDPLGQAVLVMVICLALGFVHIIIGMFIKAYMLAKRGQVLDAVFDVGFWVLFMVGLVLLLVSVALPMMAGMEAPAAIGDIGKWVAIAGAAGLILTQGRSKKNPVMKLVGGVQSLYDITGYLSDVLSYSRILALGLATGVIAQVFNIIGTLAGGGILGALIFIVVFAIGSALNLGINTLGAYVHTARLQYVEFFGKFYEAGGRPFTPFMPQTKYVLVTNKEDM